MKSVAHSEASRPEISEHLPLWLRKREAMGQFALSEKRLRELRQHRLVTFRLEGNEYVYETQSLIDYSYRDSVKAEIPESLDQGDHKLISLTREVIRREKEKGVREREGEKEKSNKEDDNA
jgi:hypothetical protein